MQQLEDLLDGLLNILVAFGEIDELLPAILPVRVGVEEVFDPEPQARQDQSKQNAEQELKHCNDIHFAEVMI